MKKRLSLILIALRWIDRNARMIARCSFDLYVYPHSTTKAILKAKKQGAQELNRFMWNWFGWCEDK